mmetsp:Transcript_11988/g.13521  ORF Transcript_11988/g.13521 Transcript_11988/m.13521 type:complete len:313 (+) Transcript_11988:24-962(+)
MSGETVQMKKEKSTKALKRFTFDKSFYDLTTYVGRFKNVWASTNPVLFFVTKDQIKKSKENLAYYRLQEQKAKERGEPLFLSEEVIRELKNSDSIVRSSVHPDTQEIIPRHMRFSAYLYANIPINFGFLLSAPTTFNIVLWQWINQTYYVGVNYANRNASSKFTNQDLVVSYFGAVAASIGVGLGVKRFIEPFKSSFTGSKAFFFMFIISCVANSAANGSNLVIIRSKEMREGIPITTKDGEEVGISKKAGKSAVLQTALTRCIMPIFPLGIPTISFFLLDKMKMIPKNNKLKVIQQIFVFSYSIMFAPAMG